MTGHGEVNAQLDRGRSGDRVALDRVLGTPALEWLVDRVRRRIPDAGTEPLTGIVLLNAPTDEQRTAVVRLVGPPRRAGSAVRVDLAVVEEILRRGPWPAGLADAVETLTGPVIDRRAEKVREAAEWDAARDALTPVLSRLPELSRWWETWCAAGGLKRAASAEAARIGAAPSPEVGITLVSGAVTVMEQLPAAGQPLSVLARATVGDAHGLDAERPLGRVVLAVVRAAFLPGEDPDLQSRRDVWAAAGVVQSTVSSTALVLGVAGLAPHDPSSAGHDARTATATSLESMRAARLPMVLTLDQVRSGGVRAGLRGSSVHVCENPTIVEVVAERWARGCSSADAAHRDVGGPVLVCTQGQASTAVVELLQILTSAGAVLRYHGDFDWGGLRIAQSLTTHVAWLPWRYSAADYLDVAREGSLSRSLTGRPAQSPWDPRLAEAMAHWGLAIEEEAVADRLAADLI